MTAADYLSAATEVSAQIGLAIAGGIAIFGVIAGVKVGVKMFKKITA